jgi:hypothetical protein
MQKFQEISVMSKHTSGKCVVALSAACVAALMGGCKETVEGKFLDTQGIAMLADVTADGTDSADVSIDFVAGGDESNTYVNLGDDRVIVGVDGKKGDASAESKGEYEFAASTGEGGTQFSIALDRQDAEKEDATKNMGTLPDDFEVMIAAGDHSRREALTIEWDPSGDADEVRIDLDGDCVFFTFESGEADDGEFVIPADELIFGSDPAQDDEGTCEVTATVTRTNHGTIDPVFDLESHFDLHQVRTAKFTSVK